MPHEVNVDPYIDASSGVLRNLLAIDDSRELERAEARIVSIAITKVGMQTHLKPTEQTLDFFLSLHKQLFNSIYAWAGQLRTVEISKGTTSFARAQYLQSSLQELFRQFAVDNQGVFSNKETLVEKLAYYYGELNVLHPFREGNGRTIRTFLSLVADRQGYYIAWDEMDAAENIQACIASYNGDESPLRRMLARILHSVE